MTKEEAKTLNERAYEYAQSNFPINKNGEGEAVKNDIAFHSFCDGWNAALSLNPWHSVEDGLPEEDGIYYTIFKTKSGLIYNISNFIGGYFESFMATNGTYTHWMPIPELPKEKEGLKNG